jgi:hypothetical protein
MELSSQIAAQVENLLDPRVSSYNDIQKIVRSEMFYGVQQLVGRGPAREAVNGFARESHVHLLDQVEFDPKLITDGLPEVTWTVPQKPKKEARDGSQTSDTAEVIHQYLMDIPEDVLKIGLKTVRSSTCPDVHKNVWQAAWRQAVAGGVWDQSGQSLVR